LVLALELPSTTWVLLDAKERRTSLLRGAVAELGLADRVEVICRPAEEYGRDPDGREQFDIVVSRAFGPPAVTAECGVPLLALGGHLVVSEPPTPEPARWPGEPLAELGLEAVLSPEHDGVKILRKVAPTPERFPRRVGVPRRRPIF
jgi:16S rRNA (guanine527-N7)-methyltransferase